MKTILVPVDFSRCSLWAVDAAIDIAIKSKASLYFLHLYPGRSGISCSSEC
jgi:nucleotide-binding universal stress UspA family protein